MQKNSIFAVLTVMLISCATSNSPRRVWDVDQGINGLWLLVEKEQIELRNLTAEIDILFKRGDQKDRASALVQISDHGMVGVEVRGPFYNHLFTIVQEGDSLLTFGPIFEEALKGAIRGPLLSNIIGIDLGRYELASFLFGRVMVADLDIISEEYIRADRTILKYQGEHFRHSILLDLYRGFVLNEQVETMSGQLLFNRTMRRYISVGSALLPSKIRIVREDLIIELNYKNFDTHKIPDPNRFKLGVPEGNIRRV